MAGHSFIGRSWGSLLGQEPHRALGTWGERRAGTAPACVELMLLHPPHCRVTQWLMRTLFKGGPSPSLGGFQKGFSSNLGNCLQKQILFTCPVGCTGDSASGPSPSSDSAAFVPSLLRGAEEWGMKQRAFPHTECLKTRCS